MIQPRWTECSRPKPEKRPELLAPAGTEEAFWAAIEHGADAVYVGLKTLSARAYARNFTLPEVDSLVQSAHARGRKLFVAMNSLVKEREIEEAVEILSFLEAIGVDALIIQDLGLWRLARTYFPGLRLHASTLLGIHNTAGVQEAHRMGFRRIVLAREMTLSEIRSAMQAAPVEIEVFVHGALCFSYSGLCRFSSYFGGKSSTRGRCVQPCRRTYTWGGTQGKYFSMADLSGLPFVWELEQMGVASLKIEGRLKPAHAVACLVAAYRMVLDADPGDTEAIRRAEALAADALGRETSPAYFLSPRPAEAVSPLRPANTGRLLGKVVGVSKGGLVVSGRIPPAPGDRLRLVIPRDDRQIPFTCAGVTPALERGTFTVRGCDPPAGCTGASLFAVDLARSPLTPSHGRTTGEAPRPRLEKKARIRAREVLAAMERQWKAGPDTRRGKRPAPKGMVFVRLRDQGMFHRLRITGARGLILEITPATLRLLRAMPAWMRGMEIVWAFPPVITEPSLPFYQKAVSLILRKGFTSFEVGNIGHLALIPKARRIDGPLFGGATLNLLNSEAMAAAQDAGIRFPQLSMETDRKNMEAALEHARSPVHLTVFAYPPLFTTRMEHPTYRSRSPVVSPRGEHLHWERAGEISHLLPGRPFSLTAQLPELRSIGISGVIIDLSHWPGDKKTLSGRLDCGNDRELALRLGGRGFNYSGGLE